jgi:hypothetical protein
MPGNRDLYLESHVAIKNFKFCYQRKQKMDRVTEG